MTEIVTCSMCKFVCRYAEAESQRIALELTNDARFQEACIFAEELSGGRPCPALDETSRRDAHERGLLRAEDR